MISRAMDYYIPRGHKNKRNKIFLQGTKKKSRYYYGDRNEYRNEYLKSDHWIKLREEKLKLNSSCQKCGNNSHVEPHHVNYKNLYDVTVDDLVSLCRKCHNKVHNELKTRVDKRKGNLFKRNMFRHTRNLVNSISRIANVDKSIVEFHLNKLRNDMYRHEKNTTE